VITKHVAAVGDDAAREFFAEIEKARRQP
jgi:hypothetical protein